MLKTLTVCLTLPGVILGQLALLPINDMAFTVAVDPILQTRLIGFQQTLANNANNPAIQGILQQNALALATAVKSSLDINRRLIRANLLANALVNALTPNTQLIDPLVAAQQMLIVNQNAFRLSEINTIAFILASNSMANGLGAVINADVIQMATQIQINNEINQRNAEIKVIAQALLNNQGNLVMSILMNTPVPGIPVNLLGIEGAGLGDIFGFNLFGLMAGNFMNGVLNNNLNIAPFLGMVGTPLMNTGMIDNPLINAAVPNPIMTAMAPLPQNALQVALAQRTAGQTPTAGQTQAQLVAQITAIQAAAAQGQQQVTGQIAAAQAAAQAAAAQAAGAPPGGTVINGAAVLNGRFPTPPVVNGAALVNGVPVVGNNVAVGPQALGGVPAAGGNVIAGNQVGVPITQGRVAGAVNGVVVPIGQPNAVAGAGNGVPNGPYQVQTGADIQAIQAAGGIIPLAEEATQLGGETENQVVNHAGSRITFDTAIFGLILFVALY
jgi:hypothetical protein